MLVAHRAARNGQRHFRFAPAPPAAAPRPRCARQRAVGRGERSNRFFRKTGSEPHLRWFNFQPSTDFFKKNNISLAAPYLETYHTEGLRCDTPKTTVLTC